MFLFVYDAVKDKEVFQFFSVCSFCHLLCYKKQIIYKNRNIEENKNCSGIKSSVFAEATQKISQS